MIRALETRESMTKRSNIRIIKVLERVSGGQGGRMGLKEYSKK